MTKTKLVSILLIPILAIPLANAAEDKCGLAKHYFMEKR